MAMRETIFINYRKSEGAAAGRLFDLLERSFGRKNIFIDVDEIFPGRDFAPCPRWQYRIYFESADYAIKRAINHADAATVSRGVPRTERYFLQSHGQW